MLAVHALIIRNKYTPENLIWMPNVAILQRNQPLSNHFQTNLRSIYPNLSKWNPHILHALTLKSQLAALREPLGFLGCPSGRGYKMTYFALTKWPFRLQKNSFSVLAYFPPKKKTYPVPTATSWGFPTPGGFWGLGCGGRRSCFGWKPNLQGSGWISNLYSNIHY